MRILLAGDTHMNRAWCETLSKLAGRWHCEWVIQLGDFGYWPGERNRRGRATGQTFLDGIDRQAERYGTRWAFLDGNHEDHAELAKLTAHAEVSDDGFVRVRDRLAFVPRCHRWSWEGVDFGALGGAYSVDKDHRVAGVDWFPDRDEVRPEDLARLGSGPLDVPLCHDVPAGGSLHQGNDPGQPHPVRQRAGTRNAPTAPVAQAVEATEPKLVVHGHWHRRYSHEMPMPMGRTCRVEGLHGDPWVHGGTSSWLIATLPHLTLADH